MAEPMNETPMEEDMMGMFEGPIPGESLTNSPDQPNPWERPPQFVNAGDAIQHLFTLITEENTLPKVLDVLEDGVPVDVLTQQFVFQGFAKGLWTTDLMLLLIEPTVYMLLFLAERAGISVILHDEEYKDIEPEELLEVMKRETELGAEQATIEEVEEEELTANIPSSLVSKLQNVPIPERGEM